MTEPKLLTERELLGLLEWNTPKQILDELRERGLIAPEPVDPLRDAVEAIWHLAMGPKGEAVTKMTAELRRHGVTLPKPKLTRERLGDAIVKVFHEGAKGFGGVTPDNITRLHAALVEQMQ